MSKFAYHFTGSTKRDGSPLPSVGEWEVYDGPVVICKSGLHASRHPFDALQYAPGNTLRLVKIEDIVEERADKLVCRRRRTIKQIDAEPLLRLFARWCASQVLHLWDAPAVVREYLATGDESLRGPARAAAWDTTWAAGDAARAARAAAWDTTWAAAWAAGDAARAAWDTAWDTAWGPAGDAQRAKFQELVDKAFSARPEQSTNDS